MKWLLVALLWAYPLAAQEKIVAGLSQEQIGITADFDGSAILIYGAVKRETKPPSSPLGLIVALEGPSAPITIRQKSRWLGLWINSRSIEVASAPSFYAVAANAPLDKLLDPKEDTRERISPLMVLRSFAAPAEIADPSPFFEAFSRIRTEQRLLQLDEQGVALQEETLFRVDFDLPANLTEGDYTARIFLMRDGLVVDRSSATIDVRRVGLERWLYKTSREQPLLYGLLALFLAAFAGWLASEAFRIIRN